ncbi:hypothetical protein DERP_006113 [Dermatophagoides pteronyssinus]|uniref:Uncharacterized protein n=1 Tax=Dermatophagoides pteronyssinus TaxID=6956 RepID=A0ABQ8JSF0_DERPT|nr:hypothetical protein DERP_006113 [Dermatophagoides pteronyssinus]
METKRKMLIMRIAICLFVSETKNKIYNPSSSENVNVFILTNSTKSVLVAVINCGGSDAAAATAAACIAAAAFPFNNA